MAEALLNTGKNYPGHEAFWQNNILYFYLVLQFVSRLFYLFMISFVSSFTHAAKHNLPLIVTERGIRNCI